MARYAREIAIRKTTALERFTDRGPFQDLFWEKFYEIKSQPGTLDVIHFFGEGGIGKTSLLSKIGNELRENGYTNVIHYSFKIPQAQDATAFLAVLARQMSQRIYGADFTLFYYAYSKYLKSPEFNLTDEQIDAIIKADPRNADSVSKAVKTGINVAADFLPAYGNTVIKFGEKAVDIIAGIIDERKRNGKKEEIADINRIEKCGREDLAKEIQHYFVKDYRKAIQNISQSAHDINGPFVIMLDDYEYMNDRVKYGNYQEDLWLSDPYNGLVNLMPYVLWVIAGRDRVNWNENVLPVDNCCELANLEKGFIAEFFRKARDPGGNPMSPELVDSLINLTGGVPVYMDMCFERFENGRCREIDEFGKDTQDIAGRYFKDRDPEERTAIEFLCALTDSWDDELRRTVGDRVESDISYRTILNMKIKGIKEQSYVEKIGDQYKIHDVYRRVVRENMDPEELRKISDATFGYLAEKADDDSLPKIDRVNAVLLLGQNIEDYSIIEKETRDKILDNIILLAEQGKYFDYHDITSKLAHVFQEISEGDPSVDNERAALFAQSRYALGCKLLGDYVKTNELRMKVYRKSVELLGEDHPDTLRALNELAITYGDLGDYAKAKELCEPVYEKSLEILGEDHPDTLKVLNNLAAAYRNLGDNEKAKELYEQIYKKRVEKLGEDHPETLGTLGYLAVVYRNLGDNVKAKELHERVYEKRMKVLGEDHPDTLRALNNLAYTYGELGEHEKARELHEQVYEKRVEKLGEDHPNTLSALLGLAIAYRSLRDYSKAKELMEHVYEKSKSILGENHPDTIKVRNILESLKNI